jgi:hypothetical protein
MKEVAVPQGGWRARRDSNCSSNLFIYQWLFGVAWSEGQIGGQAVGMPLDLFGASRRDSRATGKTEFQILSPQPLSL